MDTTPEYIAMCNKATEIQGLRQPFYDYHNTDPFVDGDFIWEGKRVMVLCADSCYVSVTSRGLEIVTGGFCEGDGYHTDIVTWLPRQDQLIEMVPSFIEQSRFVAPLADKFATYVVDIANDPTRWGISTFEQLWLSYVMEKKYGKKWTGTEWTK